MRALQQVGVLSGTGPARCGNYGGWMDEGDTGAAEPDIMGLFDSDTDLGLVCRVCGSLVASSSPYPRAHWDWHEATPGA